MAIEIVKYNAAMKNEWDRYVDDSKNGTFLFKRDYLEYHADRFTDYSLLFFKGNKLLGLLPANRKDDSLFSHQGLTYGGLVMNFKITASGVLEIFTALLHYLQSVGIGRLVYKCVPHIYHRYPAEEDLYAMFRNNARLMARNLSTAVLLENRLRYSELRRRSVKMAHNMGIAVRESSDFEPFWKTLTENLQERYGVNPVHSLKEIIYLKERFPEKIRLFESRKNNETIAGCVIYDGGPVMHVQYSSASHVGKECGASDMLFSYLIENRCAGKKYFEFGQSTEENGFFLNEGLISYKEGFGGRGINYDIYEIIL